MNKIQKAFLRRLFNRSPGEIIGPLSYSYEVEDDEFTNFKGDYGLTRKSADKAMEELKIIINNL